MADFRTNQNRKAENHGNRKALVVAVSVIFVLFVLLFAFLLSKNSVYRAISISKAEENDFKAAFSLIEKTTGEKSEPLKEYFRLRLDINEEYPQMIADFDIEKINEWSMIAESLCNQTGFLGEEISADVVLLSQKLSQIKECVDEYGLIKQDILSLMEVFAEINRLYTKDAEGKNTAFTVLEERGRIQNWERLNSKLSSFAAKIPGYENIYLLNYLIKESLGEISDLNEAVDFIVAGGYAETDKVRFGGDAERKFPDIVNSRNETVNLLEKEKYEYFMFNEICHELTEMLGDFYTP